MAKVKSFFEHALNLQQQLHERIKPNDIFLCNKRFDNENSNRVRN